MLDSRVDGQLKKAGLYTRYSNFMKQVDLSVQSSEMTSCLRNTGFLRSHTHTESHQVLEVQCKTGLSHFCFRIQAPLLPE